MSDTSKREELIRAVQAVTWNASNYPPKIQPHVLGQDIVPLTMKIVDAVEAVFEQAHTPTDDERSDLANVIRRDFFAVDGLPDDEDYAIADAVLAAGFRRTAVQEPSRQIRECVVCGEKVTMSNATEEWEKRHEHVEPRVIERHDLVMPIYDDELTRERDHHGIDPEPQGEPDIADSFLAVAEGLGLSPDVRRQALDQLTEADQRVDRAQGEPTLPLDPSPWLFISDQIFGVIRSEVDGGYHDVSGAYWSFRPRPEYEQDRARYKTTDPEGNDDA